MSVHSMVVLVAMVLSPASLRTCCAGTYYRTYTPKIASIPPLHPLSADSDGRSGPARRKRHEHLVGKGVPLSSLRWRVGDDPTVPLQSLESFLVIRLDEGRADVVRLEHLEDGQAPARKVI